MSCGDAIQNANIVSATYRRYGKILRMTTGFKKAVIPGMWNRPLRMKPHRV